MKTIDETPTRPANYALISGVYAAALSGVAAAARRRGSVPRGADLLPLGLATFTFTRVLTEQKVEAWLRRPFVHEPEQGRRRPRGRGMRYAIGELLSCTRCTGSWVGLGLVGLHAASPAAARVTASVGTIGAVNDTSLAAFSWLSSRANTAIAAAEDAA
ncbi:DUF1360 domain-containing protein [Patulibacter sp. SYSU D01012]|uniref:DUF1360 domain-containing protein n=1 Tax=Patulibacter sp. SYSU D01012 TaxID=2817381 RepID=UPI001B30F6E9|nr:DUF1360 domain-containing protein [Patulibacter sp. SYSU D01012]